MCVLRTTTGRLRGRPNAFEDPVQVERRAELFRLERAGLGPDLARAALKISRRTYYRWRADGEPSLRSRPA